MRDLLNPYQRELRGAAARLARILSLAILLSPALGMASAATNSSPAFPRIFPDYTQITLPPNIAPLNFEIREPGVAYRVEFRSVQGEPVRVSSKGGKVQVDPARWSALLRANAGSPLYVDVAAQDQQGWTRFATITNHISAETIDGHMSYRLLKPLYNAYTQMGLYQRDLESFAQDPILQNDRFEGGCLNCHTPFQQRGDTFAFNIRGTAKEQPMILVVSNEITRVDKTMGYLAWHPSGKLLAFSNNKLSLFYHTRGETRDVYDAQSNLGIYRVDSNLVVFPPPIALPGRNETWPAWSPDGRHLYYSSAAPLPVEKYKQIRYDLMRVAYDLERDQWGEPEQVVSAQETGLSVLQPKVSPDGKWLLFTMCRHGNFPIYQASSDLYLMDLNSREFHRLEINSDQADSWHSWSSNSRWMVFSSKRIDGLFARPHFAYLGSDGKFRKPFVLPQEDPTFYESFLNTFNVPELLATPVTLKQKQLAKPIAASAKALHPAILNAPAGPSSGQTGTGDSKEPYSRPMRE